MNQVASPPPTRGLIVIVVAVIVGALVLAVGFDDLGSSIGVSSGGDEEATTETTAPPVTASTLPADGRAAAEVPVYVANGSGVSGQAAAVTEQLQAAGYSAALEPGNATETQISQVYYLPDWEAEAVAVATTLSLPADRAIAMPNPVPFDGIPAEATVVVQIGTDLAGG